MSFGGNPKIEKDGNGIRIPRSSKNPRFRNLEKEDEERRNGHIRNNARGAGEKRRLPLRRVKNPRRRSMKGRKLNENQQF